MTLVDASHPALWQPAEPVTNVTPFIPMAEKMLDLMKAKHGAGLAAPQVGASVQLFVSKYPSFLIAFNPAWVAVTTDRCSKPEGSLTRPGWSSYVARPTVIHASWHNSLGDFCQCDLRDMDARVFMHCAQYLTGAQIFPRPIARQLPLGV